MPLVAFRDDFGVRELILARFFIILGCWRAPGTLPDPIWHPWPKKSEQRAKKGAQMETFWGPLPSFWPLGGSFRGPGGKKSVPKAPKGDFVDIVKT